MTALHPSHPSNKSTLSIMSMSSTSKKPNPMTTFRIQSKPIRYRFAQILCALALALFASTALAQVNHNPDQSSPGGKYCTLGLQNVPSSVDVGADGSATVNWDVQVVSQGPNGNGLDLHDYQVTITYGETKKDLPYSQPGPGSWTLSASDLANCNCEIKVEAFGWYPGSGDSWKAALGSPQTVKVNSGGSNGTGGSNKCIRYYFGLGTVGNGAAGGRLLIDSDGPNENVFKPEGILVSTSSDVLPQYFVNGVFNQALSGNQLISIANVTGSSYEIRAYKASQVTGGNSTSGWTVDNPDSSWFKKTIVQQTNSVSIAETDDDTLYHTVRKSLAPKQKFSYAIPFSGDCVVTLRFAENFFDSAGQRLMNIDAEEVNALTNFDIFSEAGGQNIACAKTFPVTVLDNMLDLDFQTVLYQAEVSAIEISKPSTATTANVNEQDAPLFQNERWGNFSYNIPVSNGTYTVALGFVERYYDSGQRSFNVTETDGTTQTTLLSNFDICAQASGRDKALVTSTTVTVTDGSIDLDFAGNGASAARLASIKITQMQSGSSVVITAINAGGTGLTASDGTVYSADTCFTGGLADAEEGGVVEAINAGGPAYTGANSVSYEADDDNQYYSDGMAFVTSVNGVRFTEMQGSNITQKYDFTMTPDPISGNFMMCTLGTGWSSDESMEKNDCKTISWSQDRKTSTETRIIRNKNNQAVSKVATTKQEFVFGQQPVEEVVDPDGAALTTSYDYNSDWIPGDPSGGYGKLKQVTRPAGAWETYEYDSMGRTTKIVSQFQGSSVGDGASTGRATETAYSGTGSNTTETRIVKIAGATVGSSYEIQQDYPNDGEFEVQNITCQTPGASQSGSDNLVSTTRYYSSDNATPLNRGQIKWTASPDGTMSLYSYSLDGSNRKVIQDYGAPNSGKTAITSGIRIETLTNPAGQTISETIKDITTGTAIKFWQATKIDDLGRPTEISYGDGSIETREYVGSSASCGSCSGAGQYLIDSETDRNGIDTSYLYDALGRRIKTIRLGVTEEVKYDAVGHVTQRIRIGTSGTITLEETDYDGAGRITEKRDGMGHSTTYAYSLGETNGETTTTITYPDGGTRIETTYGDGKIKEIGGTAVAHKKYVYGTWSGGEWTKEINVADDASETEWTKTYFNAAGKPVKIEYPDSTYASKEYNGLGQLVKETDPDGVIKLYAYNAKGELEITAIDMDQDGAISYSGSDRITQVVRDVVTVSGTVFNRTTTYVWGTNGSNNPQMVSKVEEDSYGRIRRETDASGNVTTTINNHLGDGHWTVTTSTPSTSSTVSTILEYQNGRLYSTTRLVGTTQLSRIEYAYDAHGRLYSETDARTGTTFYAYNNNDRVTTITAPAPTSGGSSLVTTKAYDVCGRPTETHLPDTSVTYTAYNLRGQPTYQHGSQTYAVHYTYDGQGRMTSMVTTGQAGSETTTWNYDSARGWLISKVYPDNKSTTYSYTPAGRLYTRSWSRPAVPSVPAVPLTTTYDYNNAGDLESVAYNDSATPGVSYTYTRTGQPGTVTDAEGTRTFSYNSSDLKLASEALNGFSGALQKTITRQYDSLRHDAGFYIGTSSTEYAVTYGYSAANRLSSVADASGTYSYGYVSNSAANLRSSLARPTGTTYWTYEPGRDALDAVENKVGATTVSKYDYRVNSIGQRRDVVQTGAGFAAEAFNAFEYNATGELEDAKRYLGDDPDDTGSPVSSWDYAFVYDGIGNRTSATLSGSNTTNYTSNTLNQYTQISGSGSTINPTYDNDGNLLTDGAHTCTWDGENRLIKVVMTSGTEINFTYDYMGRRVRKTVKQGDTTLSDKVYLYDGWNVVAEYGIADTSSPLRTWTWGIDMSGSIQGAGGVGGLLSYDERTGGGFYEFTYDGNGNVSELLDTTGTTAAHYEYSPFGEVTASSGSMAAVNPFRFSTKFQDDEAGLIYFDNRYYDPISGRMVNRDPIEEKGGMNLYGFVNNQPVNQIDALGLWGSNIHEVATKRWAKDLSYPDKAAGKIGEADDAVDGGITGGGTGWAPWGDQSYHFDRNLGNGTDTRLQHYNDHLKKAVDACSGTKDDPDTAVKELGTALHPLQDWVAHGEYGYHTTGNIWRVHNSLSPQTYFGDQSSYPDDITLDAIGSSDGRAAGAAMHVVNDGNGNAIGEYANYTHGSKRHMLTLQKSKDALNSFRNQIRNDKSKCKCRDYFGIQ